MKKLEFFKIVLVCIACVVFVTLMFFSMHVFLFGKEYSMNAITKYYIPSAIIGTCVIIGFALLAFVAVKLTGAEDKYQVFDSDKQKKVTLDQLCFLKFFKFSFVTTFVCNFIFLFE